MLKKEQMDRVFLVVQKVYGVSKEQIQSRQCDENVLRARKLLILICSEILEMPYEEIAPLMGRRERTTVLHYKNKTINNM